MMKGYCIHIEFAQLYLLVPLMPCDVLLLLVAAVDLLIDKAVQHLLLYA